MASFCRSALTAGSRCMAARSRTVTQKSIPSPFSSPPTRAILAASRVVSVMGSAESMMPLHTTIANARLKSSIAIDSSCWSWLSQEYASTALGAITIRSHPPIIIFFISSAVTKILVLPNQMACF